MRSSRGFTLVEMLIAAALFSVAALYVGRILTQVQSNSTSSRQRMQARDDLAVLAGHLQKYFSSGDMRFYGFSGNGRATPIDPTAPSLPGNDKTLARYLVPQPSRCADFASGVTDDPACAQDLALAYIHYDKSTDPAVTAICALEANANSISFVIDGHNASYGAVAFNGNGFSVDGSKAGIPSGSVSVVANQLVALQNPPFATLWVVTEAAAYKVGPAPTYAASPVFPPACVANLTLPAAAVDQLVLVKAVPLLMTAFTGGKSVSGTEETESLGAFPMKFFNATIRSVGRRVVNGAGSFALMQCEVTSVEGGIDCRRKELLAVGNVNQVRADEFFSLLLTQGGTAQNTEHYELSGPAPFVAPSAGCAGAGLCAALPIAHRDAIPVYLKHDESPTTLDAGSFSFLKQDSLAKVRFRITVNTQPAPKEQAIDVIFQ